MSGDTAIDSVDWYDTNAERYVADTLRADVAHVHRQFLAYLPDRAHILDAGCGSGRDSLAFKALGYQVTAMDGSAEMARIASALLGQPVLTLRHQEVAFDRHFDGVWSMASLLHVPMAELPDVLTRYRNALVDKGILFASFKLGEGEAVVGHRHFTYHDPESFARLIASIDGLELIETSVGQDTRPGRGAESWLSTICQRIVRR